MVDQFPGNSHTSREAKTRPAQPAEKNIRVVTATEPIRRKRPVGSKMKDFLVGFHARAALRDVVASVIIPSTRDMITYAGTTAWEQLWLGEGARYRPRPGFRGPGPGPGPTPTRYDAMSRSAYATPQGWSAARSDPRRDISPRARETHDFDEILMNTRGEAEDVIDQLNELIATYGQASVADLYAMVSISPNYTDAGFGWTSLPGANAQLVRGAYLLNLPKPEPLER